MCSDTKNWKIQKFVENSPVISWYKLLIFGKKISKKSPPNDGSNPLRIKCRNNETKLLHGVDHAIENSGVHCFDMKIYTAEKSGFRFVFSAKNNAESLFQIENVNVFYINIFFSCPRTRAPCMHGCAPCTRARNAESASHPSVLGRTAGLSTAV